MSRATYTVHLISAKTSKEGIKCTIAPAEDHKRQLNVHGLPSEFMGPTAGGVQDHALYQLFRKLRQEKIGELGIDIKQYHIIGARPVRRSLSNDQDPIMRVTLDSKDTKNRVVNAAMTVNLWGLKNKKEAFLRDIPPEKRSQTDDRKRSTKRKRSSSQEDKNAPKKPDQIGIHLRLIKREILHPPKMKTKGQENPDTARTRSTRRWPKLRMRNQHV